MKNEKRYNAKEQLQNLLNKQVANLSEEAIESKGNIPADKLEMLERLSGLIEIRKASEPAPASRHRWQIITLLVGTLIIVSILLFARVSSTEIELDLMLSEVSFRLPEQQLLTDEMELSLIGVSGINEIQLARSETKDVQVIQSTDGLTSAIRLAPVTVNDQDEGSVTLAEIILPAGTNISLGLTEISNQYRMAVGGSKLDIRVGVSGQLEVGRSGAPVEQVNFLGPKSVLLNSGPDIVDIELTPLPGAKSTFSKQLIADSISFFSIDERTSGEQTIVRRLSTILSGKLYFESLAGKERVLRSGQEIRFESSKGKIRTLELNDRHIAFAFNGLVEGMSTGSDQNQISLMPTYLEWLSARHGLSLLWGTTLYLFGLLYGIVRWWRASS